MLVRKNGTFLPRRINQYVPGMQYAGDVGEEYDHQTGKFEFPFTGEGEM